MEEFGCVGTKMYGIALFWTLLLSNYQSRLSMFVLRILSGSGLKELNSEVRILRPLT